MVERFKRLYAENEALFWAGTVVVSFGGGGVIAKGLDAALALDAGWFWSIFALVSGALLVGLQYLPPRPQAPPPEATPPSDPDRYRTENLAVPMSEAEGMLLRNRERVVRANVQNVLDELHSVKSIIRDALSDTGTFWTKEISQEVWPEVKDALKAEPGFHPAYAATRDAWHAVLRAEIVRLEHDESMSEGWPAAWEQSRIDEALKKVDVAEKALWHFLGDRS